ncbi:MAG: hypothetical protein A2W35_08615 [Chloroflexi bacterium RBG_16_57_11]|nr:MAG: hypothetical protein A2W35_08615 [Chloroflexi bacterium RBG_16_57_11]
MEQFPSNKTKLAFTLAAPLLCVGCVLLFSWVYTTVMLGVARADGVYASAEEGMLALIEEVYAQPYEAEIAYAGTNSDDGSDTHIRYVIACVWGDKRKDGSPVGSVRHAYDQPGSFFLHTKDGWVFMPEGAFPNFIGFWMKVYGLAGPGSSRPTQPMGSGGRCVF